MILHDRSSHLENNHNDHSQTPTPESKERPRFRIGMIIPEHQVITNEMINGFTTTLEELGLSRYSLFLGVATSKNQETIKQLVTSHLNQNEYDLVLTGGMSCTLAAYDITARQKKPPHLLFVDFRDPVGFGLIKSYESSGNHVTGVTIGRSPFKEQYEALKSLGIIFKNVLVIYNSDAHLLDQTINEIEHIYTTQKLNFDTFEINTYDNYEKSLIPYLERSDLVLTLRDCFTIGEMNTIARLCRRYRATLCAGEWYSVDEGANIGFGFDEKLMGAEAAHKAYLMLEHKIKPSRLPITAPSFSYSFDREDNLFRYINTYIKRHYNNPS